MSRDPIGYGKPPKKHQFKSGASGNPKGRPKGAKSLRSIVQKELASKIEIKVQGKRTKLEAAIMKLVNDALSGNAKSLSELLKLAAVHLPQGAADVSDNLPPIDEDQALLAAYVERVMKQKMKGEEDAA